MLTNKTVIYLFIFYFSNSLPDWTKSVYPSGDMKWIATRSFQTGTITPQLARLKSGFLLREILNRFTQKTKSKLTPNRSLWIYSAHDTTVANVLNTLGLFEVIITFYCGFIKSLN